MKTEKKILKSKDAIYVIVVDTNILWEKDKKLPVCSSFNEFWIKNASLANMKLYVPEIVFGELHFQQTTSALKSLNNAKEQLEDLTGIANYTHEYTCTDEEIQEQVEKKLESWLTSHSGTKVNTPVNSIDWHSLVNAAIWRKPPFTFDPKDKSTEKGFRDALILETLLYVLDNSTEKEIIVFICNDNLLKKSAENRTTKNENFLTFDSTVDFESYVRLSREQISTDFAKSVQDIARRKFWTDKDPECLYTKFKIGEKINSQFSKDLIPNEEFKVIPASFLTFNNTENWKYKNRRIQIFSTQFDKTVGSDEYHWITSIGYFSLYENISSEEVHSGTTLILKKIQVAKFEIQWKSNIGSDKEIKNLSLVKILIKEVSSIDANEENLTKYRL